VRPAERRYLYTAIKTMAGEMRFLDKTPKNILKLPYLASLFPDATFVFVKRDAPDTLNSLIEGWTVRFGIPYRLPQRLELADYRGRYWCYVLPERWREWARTSVGDVAAFSTWKLTRLPWMTEHACRVTLSWTCVTRISFNDQFAKPCCYSIDSS